MTRNYNTIYYSLVFAIMTKSKYIHIEGMDLAWKSTLVRNVKLAITNIEIRHNSILAQWDNQIYQLADSLRKNYGNEYDSTTLWNLFVVAMEHDVRNFKQPLFDTLQDSTIFLRSMAYHTVKWNERLTSELLRLFIEFNHPIFDSSIILTASIEERKKRLKQRYRDNPEEIADDDLMIINKPEKFLQMEQVLISLWKQYFNSQIIDTTSLNPDQVYEISWI